MSNINEVMKANADNAIIAAKEKFGQELDFSDQSIDKLEEILEQVHKNYSNQSPNGTTSNLVSDTATLWGSYLGEYFRIKWGGTWVDKGFEQVISILGIEFYPINLIYQKLTSHPEYRVQIYVYEAKKVIYTAVINPNRAEYLPENVGQPQSKISERRSIIPGTINKGRLFIAMSIIGIIIIAAGSILGYRSLKTDGLAALSAEDLSESSPTYVPTKTALATVTHYSVLSTQPTATWLPTYTHIPTFTPRPSITSYPTYTQTLASLATETHAAIFLKATLAPRMSPTPRPVQPTSPPGGAPPPPPPPPTVPPIALVSCEVNPSTVPLNQNITITIIGHFSTNIPGYGFSASVDSPGSGCSGTDSDGDGIAYCDGSSGASSTPLTVNVTLSSSVGSCGTSYSIQ